MIRYALRCDEGHAFESWFRDGDAFEDQVRRGDVACPHCGSVSVEKQIMAPALATAEPAAARPDAAVRAVLKALRREMLANSEDVGGRFPEEARRIHYGESDARAIRGQASLDEARALHEEGIGIVPVPVLPDERN